VLGLARTPLEQKGSAREDKLALIRDRNHPQEVKMAPKRPDEFLWVLEDQLQAELNLPGLRCGL